MDQNIQLLSQFGFSEQEAELYLICLKIGRPSVAEIARKTKKNRTAVYFHLNHLLQKGIIQEVKEGKRSRFVPLSPELLAKRFEQMTTEFKSVVPTLAALSVIEKETPEITVLDSKAGYLRIYDEISALPKQSTFYVMEGKQALKDELTLLTQKEWHTFFSRIVEREIITQGIFTEEALLLPQKHLTKQNIEMLKNRIWNIHSLPEKIFPLQQICFIYGNTVAFLFPDTSLVILIRHAGLVAVQRSMFDAIFHIAKPYPISFLK